MILQRSALGMLTLFAVSVLIFACTEILPGDVASAILGKDATPESLEAIRTALHLHDPAVVRYWRWLAGVMQGDLGNSLANGKPVLGQVAQRLQNTLFLGGVTALVAVPLSLALGILSAIFQNRLPDRVVGILSSALISFPEFFVGYVLILVLAVKLGWFSSLSMVFPNMPLGQRIAALALPVIALTCTVLAHMLRMTRAAIIGVMASPYIEMAFLNGTSQARAVLWHALPNAIAPILTVIALNLAYLVAGVIVVEVVFVYPGIGQLMVDAVAKRDVPVVQACGLVFGSVYIGLNILADVLSVVADPRLRAPR